MDSATLPAVVYKRKSRDPHNVASIEDQDRLGRADVAEQGWRLADVLSDEGRSASRFATKGRPEWDKLLDMIRDNRARVVVLWESNRGDRKLTEWSGFLDLCRDTGTLIRVVSHERTYDMSRHRDWKTLAEDGVANTYYSEQLSVVVRRGHAGAALRGDPPGPVAYGYRAIYSPTTGKREGWEVVPELSANVRHIVAWVGGHKPIMALERDLEARDIKTPSGGDNKWNQATLRKMARNPVYASLRRLRDGTMAEGNWPPIVTRQEHADAVAALDGRKPMSRPGGQRHLLSHLATCAECDAPMVGKRREDRWYYRCKDSCFSIHEWWLDDVVGGVIVARLSRPDARQIFRQDDTRSAALADELATLATRLDSFADKAADGDITAATMAKIETKLVAQITAKQRQLDDMTVPPALRQIVGADDVAAVWTAMGVQARRAIIASLVQAIVVRRPPRRWRWMVLPDPADFGQLVTFEWKQRT